MNLYWILHREFFKSLNNAELSEYSFMMEYAYLTTRGGRFFDRRVQASKYEAIRRGRSLN